MVITIPLFTYLNVFESLKKMINIFFNYNKKKWKILKCSLHFPILSKFCESANSMKSGVL